MIIKLESEKAKPNEVDNDFKINFFDELVEQDLIHASSSKSSNSEKYIEITALHKSEVFDIISIFDNLPDEVKAGHLKELIDKIRLKIQH